MGVCKFVEELSKLRKSSRNSVDNTEEFDDFKNYIHVTRNIENDLKKILRHINQTNCNSLVLLCGSAGDGKSHLLSYLKNKDEENLLENYIIYNDGTESSSPNKTAIDTLNDLLIDFSDEKLLKNENPKKSIILAINLGVLNNFIESDYGEKYKLFKSYVHESGILTSCKQNEVISKNTYFQSINFADYHMFSLSEQGINVTFIKSIIKKVFDCTSANPFYKVYNSSCCNTCVNSTCCPVKNNFEFMVKDSCQNFVAQVLVESIIKDKVILTTREMQNFLYEILVPLNFNYIELMDTTNAKKNINLYLDSITPSLMFNQKDTSPFANFIKKYDPIAVRTEKTDEEAIKFYVANNADKTILSEFENLPYKSFISKDHIIKRISGDREYRSKLFCIIKRCQAFANGDVVDSVYNSYLIDLYNYNANKISELEELYDEVEHAIKQWCGTDDDDNLCIEQNKQGYEIYEEVEFNAHSDGTDKETIEGELEKFSNYIVVDFVDENSEKPISLVIDYNLYNLIKKLNDGYIQTSEDKNNHADFLSFIKKLKNSGGLEEKIIVKSPNGNKVVFQKKKLGYSYKCK